jgi:predicted dehydrogenase
MRAAEAPRTPRPAGHRPIALVGCGGMGRRHLRAYQALRRVGAQRFELAAVCDQRADVATATAALAKELLGTRPSVFTSHETLLASGCVEALDVAADPASHHVIAVPALQAGLDVICEKPLGITVRACRAMLEAAASSGALLATAENYRRDGPNRLARAVIEHGLLGDVHLMLEVNVGGDDGVIISPWRHIRESGSIALDMGVHYTDLFAYLMGPLERVSGAAFIAEPTRVRAAGSMPVAGIDEPSPGIIRATGDESLAALYETSAGARIQLSYVPSGPGRRWIQRSVHGREGSMSVPPDRSGGPVTVQRGDRTLAGASLRRALGGFRLDGVAADLLGPDGTDYNLPFADVDAALIAIELDDFAAAIDARRAPEVDGLGGLLAVAAIWAVSEAPHAGGSVRVAYVADGTIATAQDPVDRAIGLLDDNEQEVA